ncbi:hypothetical protein BH10PSE19_BH10PSE19_11890 [soil metagenome]
MLFYPFAEDTAPCADPRLAGNPHSYKTRDPHGRKALISHWGSLPYQEDTVDTRTMTEVFTGLTDNDILDILVLTNAQQQRDYGGYNNVGATFRLMLLHNDCVFSMHLGDCPGYCWSRDAKGEELPGPDLNLELHNLAPASAEFKRLDEAKFAAPILDHKRHGRLKGDLAITGAVGDRAYLSSGLTHTATILGPFTLPGGRLYAMAASDGVSMQFPTEYKKSGRYARVKEDVGALAKDIVDYSVGRVRSGARKDNTSLAIGYTLAEDKATEAFLTCDGHGGAEVAQALYEHTFNILAVHAESRKKLNNSSLPPTAKIAIKAKITALISAIKTADNEGRWQEAEHLRWLMLQFVEQIDALIAELSAPPVSGSGLALLTTPVLASASGGGGLSEEKIPVPEATILIEKFHQRQIEISQSQWLEWKARWAKINLIRHLTLIEKVADFKSLHDNLTTVFNLNPNVSVQETLTKMAYEICYFYVHHKKIQDSQVGELSLREMQCAELRAKMAAVGQRFLEEIKPLISAPSAPAFAELIENVDSLVTDSALKRTVTPVIASPSADDEKKETDSVSREKTPPLAYLDVDTADGKEEKDKTGSLASLVEVMKREATKLLAGGDEKTEGSSHGEIKQRTQSGSVVGGKRLRVDVNPADVPGTLGARASSTGLRVGNREMGGQAFPKNSRLTLAVSSGGGSSSEVRSTGAAASSSSLSLTSV